jgi:hypothetical protein
MKGDGDKEIRALPERILGSQGFPGISGQGPAQNGVFPVLEKQDKVFEDPVVAAARPVDGKGRGTLQASRAEVVFAGAFEEPAAT